MDLSGRPYVLHSEPVGMALQFGQFPTSLTRHILESFAAQAKICIHLRVSYGRDAHHIIEAQFKALARALRYACERDPRVQGIPSTKGVL